MSDLSSFYGPNAGYALEMYERYRSDPETVDAETRSFFDALSPQDIELALNGGRSAVAQPVAPPVDVARVAAAARLARFIRQQGHLAADTDPVRTRPAADPHLDLEDHGLTTADLERLPASVVGGPLAAESRNGLDAIRKLRQVYSGSVGYDDEHITNAEERYWLRDAAESRRFFHDIGTAVQVDLLERLTEVETFERYVHRTFPGAKRFSIEGTDMLVPMLDEIICAAAVDGTEEVVLGMAHRGRLNVLAHILGKPYATILSEFEDARRDEGASVAGKGTRGWTGDVKYHLGASGAYKNFGVNELPITLVPNPSHLEFVNPVVEGHTRAAQDRRDRPGPPVQNIQASLAVLVHGDSAFPGEGIVAETLNLSRLAGYTTGGTIHIIANNQIGFTTLPDDARSTLYASDVAKGFEIPIVHVNADDPVACIAVSRMAHAYRERFHKDFLIDLVGYRRYGHNEGDEPAYTQPRMYEIIRAHSTVREIWARELERQGVISPEEAATMQAAVQERLQMARGARTAASIHAGEAPARHAAARLVDTGVPAARLKELNAALLARPEGFTLNAKLEEQGPAPLQKRREMLEAPHGILWAHAETLAFASILADGVPIRLTGQDSERGTFSQRHLVLHDPTSGESYVPLQRVPQARASFAIYNSPLSEASALGFEYGYSMHAPGVLVLWEAQFGDFANAAQVIIDQFLVSGNAKWRQIPSLVLLLPHGYEGQGPEHSSARLERFLQLAASDNIRVVNCTTAAQYFHLLRRQAALLEHDARPLVVMTPKSLLREPRAASSLQDLAEGSFQPVIDDEAVRDRPRDVTRVVLCSGKVYVDLLKSPVYAERAGAAVVRIEELYPFPAAALRETLAGYPNVREIVWMQEEPRNMGAWTFVEPRLRELVGWRGDIRYAGRTEAASPAEGSSMRHAAEQARLLAAALEGIEPARIELSRAG